MPLEAAWKYQWGDSGMSRTPSMKASFKPSRRPGLKNPLSPVTCGLRRAKTFAHSCASAKVASLTQ